MKTMNIKYLTLLLIVIAVVIAGCGGDDEVVDPGPTTSRVTAVTATTAPVTVNHVQWQNATETPIVINSISFTSKISPQNATLVTTDTVGVKAMVFSNTLYVRLDWADATDDRWPRSYYVSQLQDLGGDTLVIMTYDTLSQFEDQVMLMVREATDMWDCWNWRRVTTDGGFLAEGMNIESGAFVVDDNDSAATVAVDNHVPNFGPDFMQPDSSLRTDAYLLYTSNAISWNPQSGGWALNQRLAGVLIDSSLHSSSARRGSQWDINAVSTYAGGRHTVVLSRALNTGFADDMVLGSGQTYVARLGVTNNANFSLTVGSTNQGFSPIFNIVLP